MSKRTSVYSVALIAAMALLAGAPAGAFPGQPFPGRHGDGRERPFAEAIVTHSDGMRVVRDRYVITRYGQLEQYQSINGSYENWYELSRPMGEPGSLIGVVANADGGGVFNVFVLNRQGEIEQYQWTGSSGWQRYYLTRSLNGPLLRQLDFAGMEQNRQVVGGRDFRGRSMTYVWEPGRGWYIRPF